MKKQKHGFMGERSIVLPPMVVQTEENDPLTSSLYITDIGYYPHATHHYRNREKGIGQYVLIYCVEGSGYYTVDQQQYAVGKDQYFILPAGHPHSYGCNEGDEWTIYWIHFCGPHAAIFAEGSLKPQAINIAVNSRVGHRNNIFEEIFFTLEQGQDLESLRYASSLLHYYLASMRYLAKYREAVKTDTSTLNIVDAAIHYMEENVEKHITLQDVLNYVGYSSSHFSHLFKQQTGMSPLSYFNRLKVKHACSLLESTDLAVNKICYMVGIEDSLYFSRLFTKIIGMPPTKYRKTLNS